MPHYIAACLLIIAGFFYDDLAVFLSPKQASFIFFILLALVLFCLLLLAILSYVTPSAGSSANFKLGSYAKPGLASLLKSLLFFCYVFSFFFFFFAFYQNPMDSFQALRLKERRTSRYLFVTQIEKIHAFTGKYYVFDAEVIEIFEHVKGREFKAIRSASENLAHLNPSQNLHAPRLLVRSLQATSCIRSLYHKKKPKPKLASRIQSKEHQEARANKTVQLLQAGYIQALALYPSLKSNSLPASSNKASSANNLSSYRGLPSCDLWQKTAALASHENLPLLLPLLYVRVKSSSPLGLEDQSEAIGSMAVLNPHYLLTLHSVKNAGFQKYLLAKKRLASLYVKPESFLLIEKQPALFTRLGLQKISASMQSYVKEQAEQFLSARAAGLSLALLTGDKSHLQNQDKQRFRLTGTYHLFAVSGMHASALALFFFTAMNIFPLGMVARFLKLRKIQIKILFLLTALPLYILLAGALNANFSLFRTYAMAALLCVFILLNRRPRLSLILAISFTFAVLFNPANIYNLSFMLSFSALLGICFVWQLRHSSTLLQQIKSFFDKFLPEYAFFKYIKNFFVFTSIALAIALACWLFTLPISIYVFGEANLLSPLYNIFMPPMVMLSLLGSFCFLLLTFSPLIAFPILAQLAKSLAAILSWWNEFVLGFLHSLYRYDPGLFLSKHENKLELAFLFLLTLSFFLLLLTLKKNQNETLLQRFLRKDSNKN